MRKYIIEDCVRFLSNRDLVDDFERLHIDYAHDGGCPVGDEASIEFIRNRNPVDPLQFLYLSDNLVGIRTDDNESVTVRHKQPMSLDIVGKIVPSTVASHLNFLGHMIARFVLSARSADEKQNSNDQCDHNKSSVNYSPISHHPLFFGLMLLS